MGAFVLLYVSLVIQSTMYLLFVSFLRGSTMDFSVCKLCLDCNWSAHILKQAIAARDVAAQVMPPNAVDMALDFDQPVYAVLLLLLLQVCTSRVLIPV